MHVVAAVLGVTFFAAAFGKLDGWPRWAQTTFVLFPRNRRLGWLVRLCIPALEVGTGVLVFVRPVIGLAVGAALLVAFAIVVFALARSHAATDCNCFGALMPSTIGKALAVRNAALALLTAATALGAARLGAPVFGAPEGLLIALVGANVVLLVELERLPRQLLRGASELRPRDG